MKEILVSVIVPVYKVERELVRCIESIVCQTYKNIEIILVDDGSPDKCPNICEFYKEKDSRVAVYHKENGGLSSARNYGLDRANGEYISFIDSDDWVKEDFIEIMLTNLLKENADISIIGYTLIWDNGKRIMNTTGNEYEILDHNQAIRELFIQKKFQCMAPTKLYKKELFNTVRFPEGKLFEDVAVSLPIFKQCNKSVFCGKSKYFYYQRENSIVNSKFDYRKLSILDYCQNMLDYSKGLGGIYDTEAEAFYLKAILMLLLQAFDNYNDSKVKKSIDYLKTEIVNHKKYIYRNPYIEKRRQIILLAIIMDIPPRLINMLWKVRVG